MEGSHLIKWLNKRRRVRNPKNGIGMQSSTKNTGYSMELSEGVNDDPNRDGRASGAVPLLQKSRYSDRIKDWYPRPSSILSKKEVTTASKSSRGWHFWSGVCATMSGIVLLVNLILTIWAASTYSLTDGIGTLQQGSCSRTRTLSLYFHAVINILSTLLLGASNYCLQCLSSPTRAEIDKAHRQKVALDIGIPSLTHLRRVARSRIIAWWILAASSIPLHLFYNSAVFTEISTVDYNAYVVAESFLDGAPFNRKGNAMTELAATQLEKLQKSSHQLQNLTAEECMKAYLVDFVSAYGDVLTVSSTFNDTDSLLEPPIQGTPNINGETARLPPYSFICDDEHHTDVDYDITLGGFKDSCGPHKALPDASTWHIFDHPIGYCLSERVEEHCKLQFSLVIMIIVMMCNLSKLFCMVYLYLRAREEPLVTLGDAISSFLKHNDPSTAHMCLGDKDTFRTVDWPTEVPHNHPRRHFFLHAISLRRWIISTSVLVLYIIAGGIILKYALHWTGRDSYVPQSLSIAGLWQLGFGAVASTSIISWNAPGGRALVYLALVANLPQLLLSLVCLAYNGLYTCMLLAYEWSRFARHRASLRVSVPEGEQRSTYRLQLPLSYGIPLLILSGLIHWVMSQSIFLVRIAVYDAYRQYNQKGEAKYSCGYSCIAIITAIFIGCLMLLAVLANGCRRYETGMPFVASSSLAISAACHPQTGADDNPALLPLQWGVVSSAREADIGHCSFSAEEVDSPVRGKLYAGS